MFKKLCFIFLLFFALSTVYAGTVYKDPSYKRKTTNYKKLHFHWLSKKGDFNFNIGVPVDMEVYRYYSRVNRCFGLSNYYKYLGDSYNEEMIEQFVKVFKQLQTISGYSDDEMLLEVINFIQTNFLYDHDNATYVAEDYPKYPIETVVERSGDCEDMSFLAASIIRGLGFGVALLLFEEEGHCAIGVKMNGTLPGARYEVNGESYYYIEVTSKGWEIGVVPNDTQYGSPEVYILP